MNSTTRGPTLCSFEVRNFKIFRREKVEVHPEVTVLVGLNDVGKTSLLEAMNLYGKIQQAGFRGPLSDEDFMTSGDDVTEFIAVWDVEGETWTHRIVLDADKPEERLESQGQHWSWNPKECRLTTESGDHVADRIKRYETLARIGAAAWKLDTEIDESIYKPVEVTKQFQTPEGFLFEPSSLSSPAPLDVHTPTRSGYGWAVWLQEIINRRNDDLLDIESNLRKVFPFFGKVRVREERVRIETDISVLGSHDGSGTPRTAKMSGPDDRAGFQSALRELLKQQESRREVFIELNHGSADKEPGKESSHESMTDDGPQHDHSSPATAAQPVRIDASAVSSGLLLALAHFALVYADDSGRLLFLEEPENGLNAKITLDIMQAFLKAVRDRDKQLILTTHNGWWLDLVPKEGIRILTRDAEGAHIHSPDPKKLDRWREDHDVYPSELMSVYGPEGVLRSPGEGDARS